MHDTYDIAIIGGGIAGISVAARLAPHARVVVFEAEQALGYHASGRSAALFEENYGAPPVRALNQASAAFYRDSGYLSPRGFLLLGTAETRAAYAQDAVDLGTEPISVAEACQMVPILNRDVVEQAGYHEPAQDIDTDLLIQDFARAVRREGGQILTGKRITDICREAGVWQIAAGGLTLSARILVNAAGAWADQVAALAGIHPIGITPMRRSMARIPAPGGLDVSTWPMFFGAGETWYAKPDAGKLLVSPADEDPIDAQDAWADDMVLAEGIARYAAHVIEPVTRVETNWAGLRSFAPDRALVLGPASDTPHFFWCAGQGGYGFSTAPAASALVADLILGRVPELEPEIVAKLSPARFG